MTTDRKDFARAYQISDRYVRWLEVNDLLSPMNGHCSSFMTDSYLIVFPVFCGSEELAKAVIGDIYNIFVETDKTKEFAKSWGQMLQHVGLGDDYRRNLPEVRKAWDEYQDVLGEIVWQILMSKECRRLGDLYGADMYAFLAAEFAGTLRGMNSASRADREKRETQSARMNAARHSESRNVKKQVQSWYLSYGMKFSKNAAAVRAAEKFDQRIKTVRSWLAKGELDKVRAKSR